MVAVNVADERAEKINSVDDLDRVCPGRVQQCFEFLRDYKIPDGKGPNEFLWGGKCRDANIALSVLKLCHKQWKDLLLQSANATYALANRTLENAHSISEEKALSLMKGN
jgi:inorganic pyrophosphatase